MRWRQLIRAEKDHICLDVAYGGAFYAIVPAGELGFKQGLFGKGEFQDLAASALSIKESLKDKKALFVHPESRDLEFLYGVVIVDERVAGSGEDHRGETGLCFFADQQIDRSPTGSAVCARVALAVHKGQRRVGERWVYESLVSLQHAGNGFIGDVVDVEEMQGRDGLGVVAAVEGRAFYTGTSTFVLEAADAWTDGFLVTAADQAGSELAGPELG
ncbi:hypothetical protein HGRIS_002224 [Hohenbuehelia grisea]|uniref:trans-L-3-hydroxyproline dehydratase n=1 Tax=Hohenbuehelia grisea TaxID=104357 RepID=A0ABR3JJV1_9AGAR